MFDYYEILINIIMFFDFIFKNNGGFIMNIVFI